MTPTQTMHYWRGNPSKAFTSSLIPFNDPYRIRMGKILVIFQRKAARSPSAEGRRVAPSKTLKRSSTACLEWGRCDEVMVIRDCVDGDQWWCGKKEENVYTYYICISKCKHGTYAIKSYINVILNPMKLDGNPRWPHKYFRSKGTRWWEWIIPTWKTCLDGVVFDPCSNGSDDDGDDDEEEDENKEDESQDGKDQQKWHHQKNKQCQHDFFTHIKAENLLAQPPFQQPVPGGWGPRKGGLLLPRVVLCDSQMQETPRTRGRTRRECWTRGTRSKRPWCGALRGGHASAAAVWRHYCSARGPMITRTPLFQVLQQPWNPASSGSKDSAPLACW